MLRGRITGISGAALAAGLLTSCAAVSSGAGVVATPSSAGGTSAARLCAAPGASAGGSGPREPELPRPGSLYVGGQLDAVTALSAASVWAVGSTAIGNAVGMHWDGSKWTEVLTPYGDHPVGAADDFVAVSAVSASDIWTAGFIRDSSIGHWDGRAWLPSSARNQNRDDRLEGIAAVSATDVWAVGSDVSGKPVTMNWNGSSWRQFPSPVPPGNPAELHGVSAVSANDVWAVGETAAAGGVTVPLIEHFNGAAWTLVPSAPLRGAGTLLAVSASSPRDAWAVGGGRAIRGDFGGLIEHWDGKSWTVVPSPDLGAGELRGVTIRSADDAWAVGGAFCPGQGQLTVIEHWNGTAWTLVPSPAAGMLTGVAAASPDSAWAVGNWSAGPSAIIEHWDGKSWTWPQGFCAAPSGPGCLAPGTSSASPLPSNTQVVP
jgi:hypothetical protein